MKKVLFIILMIMCLVAFAGCSKDRQGEHCEKIDATKDVSSEIKFVSEEYEPGNRSDMMPRELMRTDKGFYHYNFSTRSLYYYDMTTGKEMYLCNKPECRHDGNAFCVATNQKYEILGNSLYNDKILSFALEETETQYVFRLLSIALDGATMDELATILTLEKTADKLFFGGSAVHIHRNKVLITMNGSGGGEDTRYYGAVVVSLDTRDVMFMNKEPFSKENVDITDVSACGNYFYYCQKNDGKRTTLYRYHIGTGIVEICELLPGFTGDYAVLSEDLIAYLSSGGKRMCSYCWSTGENKEQVTLNRVFKEFPQEGGETAGEYVGEYVALDLLTDGTYLYLPESIELRYGEKATGEYEVTSVYIHVFDREFDEIKTVNLAEELPLAGFEEMEWHNQSYNRGLRYLGEDIYWCFVPHKNPKMTTYVFHCKRSDFIAGNPEFTFVYQYNEN